MNFEAFKSKYQKQAVTEYTHSCDPHPVLSVCVITYQHHLSIRKCIDGILMQQTNFSFEVLIGDDDSTDGTREICIEYAKKYPDKIRLMLHHRENNIYVNHKPTGRFNILYNYYSAKGRYWAFCEGDDYWTDPLKLQKQVDFLENHRDYCLSCTRYHSIRDDSSVLEDDGHNALFNNKPGIEITSATMFDQWLTKTCTVVLRADTVNMNTLLGYHYFRDIHVFFHTLKKGKGYCHNFFSAVYRKHSGGLWSAIGEVKQKETSCLIFGEMYRKNRADQEIRKLYLTYCLQYIQAFANDSSQKRPTLPFMKAVLSYASIQRSPGFLWLIGKQLFHSKNKKHPDEQIAHE